jgi:hypothetical protein
MRARRMSLDDSAKPVLQPRRKATTGRGAILTYTRSQTSAAKWAAVHSPSAMRS